jgi:septal ring factor EnvC (AmiA/AmiB activator)
MGALWALIPSSVKRYFAIGLAVLLLIASGYFYFSWSQSKIEKQAEIIQQLKVQQEIQAKTIDDINRNIETTNRLIIAYEGRLKRIADDSAKLRKDLEKMNIQKIAKTNPEEAQKLVNKAIADMFLRIETISRNAPEINGAKK